MDIHKIIAEGGITFKKGKGDAPSDEKRVKTKAKKSSYVKGTHGSGAAKMKAAYKKKKAARNKRSA
ncbi:MAG: hypothetical protein RR212_02910 [Bacteroidales bacterium]